MAVANKVQEDLRLPFAVGGEADLRLRAGELRLFLQPQRALVQPGSFIAIAEEPDLIVELGVRVMVESCRLIAQERRDGRALLLSVNVSVRHFRQATCI